MLWLTSLSVSDHSPRDLCSDWLHSQYQIIVWRIYALTSISVSDYNPTDLCSDWPSTLSIRSQSYGSMLWLTSLSVSDHSLNWLHSLYQIIALRIYALTDLALSVSDHGPTDLYSDSLSTLSIRSHSLTDLCSDVTLSIRSQPYGSMLDWHRMSSEWM